MRIEIEYIYDLCIDVLIQHGLSQDDARIIVDEYVFAELTDNQSHGLFSFPKVVKMINSKYGNCHQVIIKEGDSYALIDGCGNLGQLVGHNAIKLCVSKARKTGISIVGIINMESYLLAGYYTKYAADNMMIGIALNTTKSKVCPYGGVEPYLGTNPLSIAIPNSEIPFILDFSTSAISMADIRYAISKGELISSNIAMNIIGESVENPIDIYALKAFGGHKGYGLSLAIEILAGALIGAKMGPNIVSRLDKGFLFIVIDPTIFIGLSEFTHEVKKYFDQMKESQLADGFDEIRIPGEKSIRLFQSRLKEGSIEIDVSTIKSIEALRN